MPHIEWAMVSALAASVGVIIAIIVHVRNLADTRLSNSAKMVLDLVRSFESTEMRARRGEFSKSLLEARDSISLRLNSPILEFFEDVAYMTRRGVLDEGMVWNSFGWWFEPYYAAVTREPDPIKRARSETKSPSLFREVDWLYERMQKVGMREEKTAQYFPLSPDELENFLKDEMLARHSAESNCPH